MTEENCNVYFKNIKEKNEKKKKKNRQKCKRKVGKEDEENCEAQTSGSKKKKECIM